MLASLMDCGWEFPDASVKAANNYHVNIDDLRNEYDKNAAREN